MAAAPRQEPWDPIGHRLHPPNGDQGGSSAENGLRRKPSLGAGARVLFRELSVGLSTSRCRSPIPVFIWNLVLSTGGRFFDDGLTLG